MVNVFIVQPLSGREYDKILADRTEAYKTVRDMLQECHKEFVCDTIFIGDHAEDYDKDMYNVLYHLNQLKNADIVVLSRNWRKDWLCCIEREIAEHTGKSIITWWDMEKYRKKQRLEERMKQKEEEQQ